MESLLTSLLAHIMREKKSAKPAKAYSYLRFSTPEQRAGDSFRRQTELARSYAAANGMVLDEELTYHDTGVSGFRGTNAEKGKLGEFLEAVRAGIVQPGSFLLVENLDRLSRQTARKALRTLEDIIEAGVTVVTLMDGRKYDRQALDRDGISLLVAILTMMRAHEESLTKQKRATEAWKAALNKARAGTGRGASACPSWIRPTADKAAWELVPERAAVVRRIFEMARDGTGKDSIAARLNSEGVPTFGGKRWYGSYIVRILVNRAVLGEHTPTEKVTGPTTGEPVARALERIKDYYPAAISKRLWDDVAPLQSGNRTRGSGQPRLTSNPRRGKHAAHPVANLFGGLARCPNCGGTMTRKNPGKNHPRGWAYLVCSNAKAGVKDPEGKPLCAYRSVGYEVLEKEFVGRVAEVAGDAPGASARARELEKKRRDHESALFEIGEQLQNLLRVAAKSSDPRPAALVSRIQELQNLHDAGQAELEKLTTRAADAEKSLVASRLHEMRAVASKLAAAKAVGNTDLAAERRTALNTILRRLLTKVVIDYKSGSLEFEWRHADEVTSLRYAWPEADEK